MDHRRLPWRKFGVQIDRSTHKKPLGLKHGIDVLTLSPCRKRPVNAKYQSGNLWRPIPNGIVSEQKIQRTFSSWTPVQFIIERKSMELLVQKKRQELFLERIRGEFPTLSMPKSHNLNQKLEDFNPTVSMDNSNETDCNYLFARDCKKFIIEIFKPTKIFLNLEIFRDQLLFVARFQPRYRVTRRNVW